MKKRLICIIGLSVFLSGCTMDLEETTENQAEQSGIAEESAKEDTNRPVFYTKSLDVLGNKGKLNVTDYYITNRVTAGNHYYIDENAVLWGEGQNGYGQLGNGEVSELDPYAFTTEPFRIAENVVSLDCSGNSYFAIYLTAEGELYGMGANIGGLLGDENGMKQVISEHDYEKVPVPVLLMEDVAYARAGRESIVALKEDGSVWWWGQYQSVYLTEPGEYEDYWTTIEDENNKSKMLYNFPKKILDDCIYATTGDWTGAAISKAGELYTWGLNVFGECGTPVTDDDYVRVPQKVLEDVRMVWVDEIKFNSIENAIPEMMDFSTNYIMNMFVELENGELLASGQNIGTQTKTIGVTGDLLEESTHTYSDMFIPIEILDVSEVISDTCEEIEREKLNITEAAELFEKKQIHFSFMYIPNEKGESPKQSNAISINGVGDIIRFDEQGEFLEIQEEITFYGY